jgi:hypothetical protein
MAMRNRFASICPDTLAWGPCPLGATLLSAPFTHEKNHASVLSRHSETRVNFETSCAFLPKFTLSFSKSSRCTSLLSDKTYPSDSIFWYAGPPTTISLPLTGDFTRVTGFFVAVLMLPTGLTRFLRIAAVRAARTHIPQVTWMRAAKVSKQQLCTCYDGLVSLIDTN